MASHDTSQAKPHSWLGTETPRTRAAEFVFETGYPTAGTAQRLFDLQTLNRAPEGCLKTRFDRRPLTSRRITPAQPVPDHEDDAAHDPPVIDLRNAMRQWKAGLDPAHLRLAQQPHIRQSQRLLSIANGSTDCLQRERFNRS